MRMKLIFEVCEGASVSSAAGGGDGAGSRDRGVEAGLDALA